MWVGSQTHTVHIHAEDPQSHFAIMSSTYTCSDKNLPLRLQYMYMSVLTFDKYNRFWDKKTAKISSSCKHNRAAEKKHQKLKFESLHVHRLWIADLHSVTISMQRWSHCGHGQNVGGNGCNFMELLGWVENTDLQIPEVPLKTIDSRVLEPLGVLLSHIVHIYIAHTQSAVHVFHPPKLLL